MAGLVWVLGLLAVSPALHQWLHELEVSHRQEVDQHAGCCHHGTHAPLEADTEDGCVVQWFAQGIETGAGAIVWEVIWSAVPIDGVLTPVWVDLKAPRYLRQPERGPPAAA